MGFTSRVSRVWGIGIVDRLCRLKLDLEAVVEDANEEVYSFQIQRSLIYLKFVGGCTSIGYYLRLSSYPTISTSTFYHNPSQGGIILRNLIILNHVWVPAVKLSLLSSTAVTYSSKRGVIVYLRIIPKIDFLLEILLEEGLYH